MIRVVWMVAIEIAAIDRPAVAILEQRRVDRGRVAIELHPDAQAVGEDGGDARTLVGELALFLHERGQRNGVVEARLSVQAGPLFAKSRRHDAAEPLGRSVAAQL